MQHLGARRFARPTLWVLIVILFLAGGAGVWAIVTELGTVDQVHNKAAEHVDQMELKGLVASGRQREAFTRAFEMGDELFEVVFNALDGVGANVGNGQRFTRVPRADLKGPGQWFNHRPFRLTGPNADSCNSCHNRPFDDGAGGVAGNVHRDAFRTGRIEQFVQRNTPHVFAVGAIQRLAEEMTADLLVIQQRLEAQTCQDGLPHSVDLVTKGVNYGTLSAVRATPDPCRVVFNTDGVRGIDFAPSEDNPEAPPDLIVRPFQWKGSVAFVRDFNRGASHNELGMQAVEVVGDNVDGDFDGVVNEMTIGDQTALAVYLAAQPRPTTLTELAALDLIDALPSQQAAAIRRGSQVFSNVGCATCHVPSLTIDRPIFSEPSQSAAYRDGDNFPAGQSTAAVGVEPRFAVTFDLTRDQPDNVIMDGRGGVRAHLGSLQRDSRGRAIVELFGDMKRHVMGPRLAEPVNEIAGDDVTPLPPNPRNRHTPDTFMTEALWGVGSTAPYMHDGRATTLTEAILEHANPGDMVSEARFARAAFLRSSLSDKRALIAFLENLVLFKLEPARDGEPPKATVVPKGVKLKIPHTRS